MAAAGNLFDLSGQTQQYLDQRINPALPSGTKSGTTTGTVSESSSSSGSKSFSSQNTPQFALDALQSLIAQLSDKTVVSEQEANAKFPMLQYGYDAWGNWGLNDPVTKQHYAIGSKEALKIQAERATQRQQMISEGGIIEGGTAETKRATADRQTEISRNRETQGKYSKEAAFIDADALTGRFTRQLLEQLMPNINKAVEASGTSGGAVAGILAQDAASRTAEAQAALGLSTAATYGQINNQLASTLELLTRMDQSNPTIQMLLQTLNLAKGTINVGTEFSSQNTTGTKTTQSQTDESQVGIKPTTPTAPSAAPAAQAVAPINYGPSSMSIEKTTAVDADSQLATLIADLAKNNPNDFSSGYQF